MNPLHPRHHAHDNDIRARLEYLRIFTPSSRNSFFYEKCGFLIDYVLEICSHDAMASQGVLRRFSHSVCTSIYLEKIKEVIQTTFSTYDEHCLYSDWSLKRTQEFGVNVCIDELLGALSNIDEELRLHANGFWRTDRANTARTVTAQTVLCVFRGVIVRKDLYDVLVEPSRGFRFWEDVIDLFELIEAQLLPPALFDELRILVAVVTVDPEYHHMRDPNLCHRFHSLIAT